jgi:hypothetical protein
MVATPRCLNTTRNIAPPTAHHGPRSLIDMSHMYHSSLSDDC